jgi:hypothetical protein
MQEYYYMGDRSFYILAKETDANIEILAAKSLTIDGETSIYSQKITEKMAEDIKTTDAGWVVMKAMGQTLEAETDEAAIEAIKEKFHDK